MLAGAHALVPRPLSEAARILNLMCKVWQEQELRDSFKVVVSGLSRDIHCPEAEEGFNSATHPFGLGAAKK
jgi:hypothetical protein